MRWSPFLFAAAASLASASVFPRMSVNLPASAFPKFEPVPFEQAQAETEMIKALELNETSSHPTAHRLVKLATSVQTAAAAACENNPNTRIEWRNYATSDRLAFIASIKCLMGKPPVGRFTPPSTNRYEDFVRLHQWYMPNIHGNANFIIWHRYFLWTFEQILRKECGFDRAMPWWNEPLDAGHFGSFDMFSSKDYFGNMVAYPNGDPVCIGSGAFAGLTCHVGPGQSNSDHCLSRANNDQLTQEVSQAYVDTCNSRTSYADMASCHELGPHAYGHNGMGGVMSDVSASVGDPVFWMHHTFIDHSFRIWQNVDTPVRTTTINGVDVNGVPLDMNYEIAVGGIMPNVKLGDIMNTMGGVVIGGVPFCYRYSY